MNDDLIAGIELRCDVCHTFLPFSDKAAIEQHYTTLHKGRKIPTIDLNEIMKFKSDAKTSSRPSLGSADGEHLADKKPNSDQFYVKHVNSQEIESDPELAFISPGLIARARDFANAIGARLYKFKTLADGKAYKILNLGNGRIFEFEIFINEDERKRAARTLFDKDVNLNHYLFMPGFNFVIEAEDVNGATVGLMIIEDPIINELYDLGLVNGVSVEYYTRREECHCETKCNCEHYGVIYVAIAVVTVPFNPADGNSEFVQFNFAQLSGPVKERLVQQIQAVVKQKIHSQTDKLSYQTLVSSNYGYQRSGRRDSSPEPRNRGPSADETPDQTDNMSEKSGISKSEEQMTTLSEQDIKKLVAEEINEFKKTLNAGNTEPKQTNDETAKLLENIAKLTENVGKLTESNTALKAEVVGLSEKVEKLEKSNVSGLGGTGQKQLSKEELGRMLPHKLAETDLGEIIRFEAEKRGMTEDQYVKSGLARRQ